MATAHRDSVFANHNFRLLFGGSTISMLGDQFTLVALPWLVLKLTGNPAALGLVLAAMALPRALFMLIGGALVDRLSPRRVLLAARGVNALLVALLAALVLLGDIRMWLVYLIALGIGLSTAFAYPAGSAILPQLVRKDQLQAANALVMGMRQLSMFVGPALAGVVISVGTHGAQPQAMQDAEGLGLAFTVDAVSFAFSLASLLLIRVSADFDPKPAAGGVLANVASGVRMIWADLPLRAFMLYAAVVSVFVGGPLQVGLPVLADTRTTGPNQLQALAVENQRFARAAVASNLELRLNPRHAGLQVEVEMDLVDQEGRRAIVGEPDGLGRFRAHGVGLADRNLGWEAPCRHTVAPLRQIKVRLRKRAFQAPHGQKTTLREGDFP